MDAMSPTEQLNEVKRLDKVLEENPNDVEALVKLSTFLKKNLELKRKVLNKALSLDPTNKAAREMLLELDRAKMTRGQPQAASFNLESTKGEKTFAFRYPIVYQVFVYLLIAFTIFVSSKIITTTDVLMVFGAFLLFLSIPLWFVTVIVKVSSSGLKVSRLFGIYHQEVDWTEIITIKLIDLGQGMLLTTAEGKLINISSQIPGYSTVVERLGKIRPDLFR